MVHELVAGDADDFELVGVGGFYFFVEGFEAFELGGEAAFGGGVDDEDDFVLEVGEGIGLSFSCSEGQRESAMRFVKRMMNLGWVGNGRTIKRLEIVECGC